jgi:hypothetical protein
MCGLLSLVGVLVAGWGNQDTCLQRQNRRGPDDDGPHNCSNRSDIHTSDFLQAAPDVRRRTASGTGEPRPLTLPSPAGAGYPFPATSRNSRGSRKFLEVLEPEMSVQPAAKRAVY